MIADIKDGAFSKDEIEQGAKDICDVDIANYLLELIFSKDTNDCKYYWFRVMAAKWVTDKLGEKK